MKSDLRIEAYGTLDELNAVMGLVRVAARELLPDHSGLNAEAVAHLDTDWNLIQQNLFVIGSRLACADAAMLTQLPQLPDDAASHLEIRMDAMSVELKPLQAFVLPGGTLTASYLHLARTVCRRAERCTVELAGTESIGEELLVYLNRLSDYFFVASRFANHLGKIPEYLWQA